jgi:hypothetical protein
LAVMADLFGRVGKMLAMRPMTIIPLRRGWHPPLLLHTQTRQHLPITQCTITYYTGGPMCWGNNRQNIDEKKRKERRKDIKKKGRKKGRRKEERKKVRKGDGRKKNRSNILKEQRRNKIKL